MRAHDVIKARRVVADFSSQLSQRVEFTRARGHLHLLSAPIQRNELHQVNLEVAAFVAHRFQASSDA